MHFRFISIFIFIASLFFSHLTYAIDFLRYELSDALSDIREPRLSPDSKLIFFESTENFVGENRKNVEQLYVMSIDGSNLRQVTHNNTSVRIDGWFSYPQDEIFMIFKVVRDGLCEVYKYDFLDKSVSLPKNNSRDNTGCSGNSFISFSE